MDFKNNKRPKDSINEFFRRSEEGENIPNDICKRATVDVLNNISSSISTHNLKNVPKRILNNIQDELTAEQKLIKNCIETNMISLDCFYRFYKLNNKKDDYIIQLDTLFDLYSRQQYKDLSVACNETAKKIEDSI